MRVLIVEDKNDARERIVNRLSTTLANPDLRVAASRDSALRELEGDPFDLLVCDIILPTEDGAFDSAEDHGFSVFAKFRNVRPGTPAIFLTGYASPQNTKRALRDSERADIYGVGDEDLVNYYEKDFLSDCIDEIVRIERELTVIDSIPVEWAEEVDPSKYVNFTRAARILARRKSATRVNLKAFSGLSGAATGMAELKNAGGHSVATVFLKVGKHADMVDELRRYDRFVTGVLDLGFFPPAAGSILHNLHGHGSVFYTLASKYSQNAFQGCNDGVFDAGAFEAVKQSLQPWHGREDERSTTIGDLRRTRASDDKLSECGVDVQRFLSEFEEFESETFTFKRSVQHGDLHGENILLTEDLTSPLLIDFGDVGILPSVLDPITLEFSILFHKKSPAHGSNWPSIDQAQQWPDLESYISDCPYAGFLRWCRNWAESIDRRAVAPVVYGHAVRQLKYDDVPNELALAVARGAVDLWRSD